MQQIEIVHPPKDNEPFLVINKPAGIPSAPLSPDDKKNAFSQSAAHIPQLLEVRGRKEIEHGLLHRLDTQTSGLLLIAATQECYAFLQEQQKNNLFQKTYTAKCAVLPENPEKLSGFPERTAGMQAFKTNPHQTITLCSYFRNYATGNKEVRPVTQTSGKAAQKKCRSDKKYETKVTVIEKKDGILTAQCSITAGYRHQVRCHLAWLGIPVINDRLYNFRARTQPECECSADAGTDADFSGMQFFATGLSFINPATGERIYFSM